MPQGSKADLWPAGRVCLQALCQTLGQARAAASKPPPSALLD